jgi:hypothetical protein
VPFEQSVSALVSEWQKRLRLLDWDLKVIIESEEKPYMAVARCAPAFQSVELLVVHPDFHPKDKPMHGVHRDLELTVVHELLHARTCSVPESVAEYFQSPVWEASIELMAQAMVAAKRGQERYMGADATV